MLAIASSPLPKLRQKIVVQNQATGRANVMYATIRTTGFDCLRVARHKTIDYQKITYYIINNCTINTLYVL